MTNFLVIHNQHNILQTVALTAKDKFEAVVRVLKGDDFFKNRDFENESIEEYVKEYFDIENVNYTIIVYALAGSEALYMWEN